MNQVNTKVQSAALSPVQLLDQAKKVLDGARERRARVTFTLEGAREQYQAAAKEAVDLHKTSDVAQLEAILAHTESENLAEAQQCAAAVTDFDNFLNSLEKALEDPEALTALLEQLERAEKQRAAAQAASQPVAAADTTPALAAVAATAAPAPVSAPAPAAVAGFAEDDI